MKKPVLAVAIATLLGACASPADPWLASGAGAMAVSAGEAAPILTLAVAPVDCEPRPAPTVAIVQEPSLGAVFVEPGERPIDPDGLVCPEDAVQPINTVFYETAAAGPAFDTMVLRETGEGVVVERDHAIQIRIR